MHTVWLMPWYFGKETKLMRNCKLDVERAVITVHKPELNAISEWWKCHRLIIWHLSLTCNSVYILPGFLKAGHIRTGCPPSGADAPGLSLKVGPKMNNIASWSSRDTHNRQIQFVPAWIRWPGVPLCVVLHNILALCPASRIWRGF